MMMLKHIQLFENYSKLNNDIKHVISKAVAELKDRTDDTISIASMAVNPKSYAGDSQEGKHRVQGLGQPFAAVIPGSITTEDNTIKVKVEHGVNYENGKKTRTISCVCIDKKNLTYTIEEEKKEL